MAAMMRAQVSSAGAMRDPMPSATVEGCGTNALGGFSIGFVSQFGENDGNPFVSVDCRENRNSYDPNDKEAFPKGVGAEHCPVADEEAHVLLIEPAGTPNTGDAATAAPRRIL